MTERLAQLLDDLRALRAVLREDTMARHDRVNPFMEDVADWHETARVWSGAADGVTIYDSTTVVGDVEIGEGTWIGPFCSLDGTGGLVIGRGCSIAAGAQLLSHDTVRWAVSGGAEGPERSATRIGDRCFVGTHAVVLRGVTVGDRCVIGAGAVVTRDVPAETIVAGVPAVPIGRVVDGPDGRVELRYDRPEPVP